MICPFCDEDSLKRVKIAERDYAFCEECNSIYGIVNNSIDLDSRKTFKKFCKDNGFDYSYEIFQKIEAL